MSRLYSAETPDSCEPAQFHGRKSYPGFADSHPIRPLIRPIRSLERQFDDLQKIAKTLLYMDFLPRFLKKDRKLRMAVDGWGGRA